jgi:nickel/cobalt exporter
MKRSQAVPKISPYTPAVGLFLIWTGAANAHPHIMIDAKATIVFDDSGAVSAVRHSWTFDAAFSAWSVQGIDTDRDGTVSPQELQARADDNMVGLAQFEYYTYAFEEDHALTFGSDLPANYAINDGRVTLSFEVAPQPSYWVGDTLHMAINDPEYYVAIEFASPDAVTTENMPAGCDVAVVPPEPLDPALEERLYSLGPEVLDLPPDLAAAMKWVQGEILLRCGSASDQPDDTSGAQSPGPKLPFGGAPPDPGSIAPP